MVLGIGLVLGIGSGIGIGYWIGIGFESNTWPNTYQKPKFFIGIGSGIGFEPNTYPILNTNTWSNRGLPWKKGDIDPSQIEGFDGYPG